MSQSKLIQPRAGCVEPSAFWKDLPELRWDKHKPLFTYEIPRGYPDDGDMHGAIPCIFHDSYYQVRENRIAAQMNEDENLFLTRRETFMGNSGDAILCDSNQMSLRW